MDTGLLRHMASPLMRSTTGRDVVATTSFEALCREHTPLIARWVERFGGPGIDADEAVQDVLMTVARRLAEFRGEAKLTTWLFRITIRVVANQRRAAKRRLLLARLTPGGRDRLAQVPDDAAGPGAALEQREAAGRFYRVLEALPERYREVLVLFEVEELSTDEIARLMDRPPATVRVWLHRGRAKFIDEWARQRRKDTEP